MASRTPFAAWWLLGLLCLAAVLSLADRQVIAILIEPLRADLRISDLQVGLLHGFAFGLFYGLMGVPIATFADTGDRRVLVAVGLALWSAATAMAGLAEGFALFLIARMFVGIGEATLNPAAYSLLADMFPAERLGRAIGVFQAALAAGVGIALMTIGGLYEWLESSAGLGARLTTLLVPWRATMLLIALPGIVLALVFVLTIKEPPRRASKIATDVSLRSLVAALRLNRAYLATVICAHAPLMVGSYGMGAWFPSYLMRVHGLSVAEVGTQFGLVSLVTGLTGAPISGFVADRLYRTFGRRAPLFVLAAVMAGTSSYILAPLMPTAPLALTFLGLGNWFCSMSMPLVPTLIQFNAPPDIRARVSGLWLATYIILGMCAGTLIVPFLADHLLGGSNSVGVALSITFSGALVVAAGFVTRAIRIAPRA